jgi:hypothetical protein
MAVGFGLREHMPFFMGAVFSRDFFRVTNPWLNATPNAKDKNKKKRRIHA